MSKYVICCETCFEKIGKRNTAAARLWMDFCVAHKQKAGMIKVVSGDVPEVRVLELLGFITSTDKPGHLIVDVKGHLLTDDGNDFYCLEGGDHGID